MSDTSIYIHTKGGSSCSCGETYCTSARRRCCAGAETELETADISDASEDGSSPVIRSSDCPRWRIFSDDVRGIGQTRGVVRF